MNRLRNLVEGTIAPDSDDLKEAKSVFGDWFSDVRTYLAQRLKSPVVGPFTVAWLVSNWRLVSFFVLSDQTIEQKILYIEDRYFDVSNLLWYPLAFALAYSLALPWAHYWIEQFQDKANFKRRIFRLSSDTKYLKASVARAEVQANLNRILAQDQITRRHKDELEQLRKQADEVDAAAQAKIEAAEAGFRSRVDEYQATREADNEKTEAQRLELEQLNHKLEAQIKAVEDEQKGARLALRKKERELELRMTNISSVPTGSSDVDFGRLLLSQPYRLFHNPKVGPERSKIIVFESGGQIGEGRNNSEDSWRIERGKLELIQKNGRVHSRFYYLPPSRIFVHTGDKDTTSARGQYIIPEPPPKS